MGAGKIIKPKSNKVSSSIGGKNAAATKKSKTDVVKRRKEANKDWPWWIPK
tara:strand:+ start:2480 stop:2632 length:153 start_codon:yes stop_codon:yes gene_type:complete